jgi:hypothetical protein
VRIFVAECTGGAVQRTSRPARVGQGGTADLAEALGVAVSKPLDPIAERKITGTLHKVRSITPNGEQGRPGGKSPDRAIVPEAGWVHSRFAPVSRRFAQASGNGGFRLEQIRIRVRFPDWHLVRSG